MEDTEKAKDSDTYVGDSQFEKKTETQAQPPAAPGFPEGGFWGWSTLAGATLMQYCTFGYTNAFGVYQEFYVREYLTNYTPSDIGWIGGMQIFLIFSTGIFTGRAFDRGYFYYLMIASAVFHSLALFTLSVTHENQYYQIFLAQGVCLGLSNGLCYIPTLSIPSHYFQRQRPLAMGIVAAGSALGAVLHPIMLNKLFNGPVGFHNGVRISAALNTSLLIIAISLMRTRLPPKKTGAALPLKEFFSDPPYAFFAAATIMFFGLFYPVFYLQINAVNHGLDANFSFYSIPILNAASVFGRTVPTIFAHRFGVFNLYIFFVTASAVIICTMSLVHNVAGTVVFGIAYGFCSGATIAFVPPVMATLSKDISEIGVRLGIQFTICGIIGLFATPILGALLTNDFHWLGASLFAGLTMVFAGLLASISRTLIAKRKGRQIV